MIAMTALCIDFACQTKNKNDACLRHGLYSLYISSLIIYGIHFYFDMMY